MGSYVLLEGIPGAGKSTMCGLVRGTGMGVGLIPDLGNPATLEGNFCIDYDWVVEIECLKSRLSQRSSRRLCLQERGYLSVLAFHAATGDGSYGFVRDMLLEEFRKGLFVPPDLTVVIPLDIMLSAQRQPGVRMPIWRDVASLQCIQDYYLEYARKPLFGERVAVGTQDMALSAFMDLLRREGVL